MSDKENTPKLRRYQARTFILTWMSYAGFYLTRKPFAAVKSALQTHLGMSTQLMGYIDFAYLVVYAAGQFINGNIGDRVGARRLLSFGMFGSAIMALLFGINSLGAAMLIIWALNGYFQSTGWPGNVKAMAPWFGEKGRGTVMGFWATCYMVGGIAGTALAGYLVVNYTWRVALITPAVLVSIIGALILIFLVNHPRKVGLRSPAEAPLKEGEEEGEEEDAAREGDKVTFKEAFALPGIKNLGGAYFFLKLIRYTLLFWLPFYYAKELGYADDQAAYLSTSFEVGGIAGTILIGWASDRWAPGRRVLFAAPMVLSIGVAMIFFQQVSGWGAFWAAGSMALVGFMLFGPDSLLSGAAAQDIGGSRAAGSAAGVINGLGSIGGAISSPLAAYVSEAYGWSAVFYMLTAGTICATAVLAPVWLRQWKGRRAEA